MGIVEAVVPAGVGEGDTRRAQRIVLRFTGKTSAEGDSGAPVLALDDDGKLHLLGFHYSESGEDPELRVNTTSSATAASAVLDHIGLSLL